MSELEQCLSEFEAEFQEQGAHPAGPSRFGGRLWLGIERALMARFLEFDLGRYYGGEAADQIVFQLRMQLFLRRHFPGHTLGRWVAPDLGVALPATVLGVPWSPRPDQEPWASGAAPICCPADLVDRPLPDFHTAGMMPAVLRIHAQMKRLLGDSFAIGFPGWPRGPLGNAFYLAGCERTLTSMVQDRAFFHALMRYGMDAMEKWLTDRAEFLGEPMPTDATVFNDEVSGENFSARTYEEMIAPYDQEFRRFHGGKAGFHSCGNTSALMPAIAAAGPWSYMHVSAWSDLDKALECFPDTTLVACLHPHREVLGCPFQTTQRRIHEILDKCHGRPFVLAVSELLPVNDPAQDLQRIKDVWSFCQDVWPD